MNYRYNSLFLLYNEYRIGGDVMVKDSFIAISDFHGVSWPISKICNYYLNEYDKIYILGDAMDRGSDGIFNLLNIKSLQEMYPNRVFYLPGNHDQFLYNYAVSGSEIARLNMERNGGNDTLVALEYLKRNNQVYGELVNWLGRQPLQRTHEFNGKKYAFSHAFFEYKLYKDNPSFALKDIPSNQRIGSLSVLWYRAQDGVYDPRSVPPAEYEEVIGHTPTFCREGVNLDLKNANGERVKVHCVDDGTFKNGTMLKFDGSTEVIRTRAEYHVDTSPKEKKSQAVTMDGWKYLLNKYIYENLANYNSVYSFASILEKIIKGELISVEDNYDGDLAACFFEVLSDYSSKRSNVGIKVDNFSNLIVDYVSEVVFEEICNANYKRFGGDYLLQTLAAFEKRNFGYITNKTGARDMASRVGFDNLLRVPFNKGFNNMASYIRSVVEVKNQPNKDNKTY